MNLTPITRETFGGRSWIPHSRFDFARPRGVIALSAAELPQAVCSLPVGLLAQADGTWLPAALAGVDTQRNLFVAADGSWLAGYAPKQLRTAPFVLANTEHGERVICVDDSFVEAGPGEGQPFFEASGEPSAALAQVRDELAAMDANRQGTLRACDALHTAGLLQPWDIAIPTQAGTRRVEGLFCVNEDALNGAEALTLAMLRDTGALAVAYCLLISMQHLGTLGKLADAHAAHAAHAGHVTASGADPAGSELDLEFLNRSETLRFDH